MRSSGEWISTFHVAKPVRAKKNGMAIVAKHPKLACSSIPPVGLSSSYQSSSSLNKPIIKNTVKAAGIMKKMDDGSRNKNDDTNTTTREITKFRIMSRVLDSCFFLARNSASTFRICSIVITLVSYREPRTVAWFSVRLIKG